jgi:hypothetical protein
MLYRSDPAETRAVSTVVRGRSGQALVTRISGSRGDVATPGEPPA